MKEPATDKEEVLLYWRKRIFNSILKGLLVIGFLAYAAGMTAAVVYKIWSVAFLDTLIYLSLIALYFFKNLSFSFRVFGLNFILYLLGLGLLIFLGPAGAGWVWLFAFPLLGTVLHGIRAFLIATTLNIIAFVVLGYLLHQGQLSEFMISRYSMESWTVISINFLCLTLLLSFPIALLVKGMERALLAEQLAKKLLLAEQGKLFVQNKDLIKTNADLDNFIYTASHDLKSPILNIEGLVTNLDHELAGKQSKVTEELFEMIYRSVNKFKTTIRDLTEISKAQKNILESIPEPVDIEEVLNDVLSHLEPALARTAFTIHRDLQAKKINFSKKNFRSILYNLVSNAIKYASPERNCEVSITTFASGKSLSMVLQDNGLGMTAGYEGKIFKMFKRMHDHVEGTGIGLYIVKRIVDNNGGNIEVHSVLGQGTTVRVFLNEEA